MRFPISRPNSRSLERKLIDLDPVLRDYVYHPGFQGSFSLKYILTPLVPELTYDDLVVIDGLVASVKIAGCFGTSSPPSACRSRSPRSRRRSSRRRITPPTAEPGSLCRSVPASV